MSNLPPGCRVSDIPGNRSEDEVWEGAIDATEALAKKAQLSAEEYVLAFEIGVAAIAPIRKYTADVMVEHRADLGQYIDWLTEELRKAKEQHNASEDTRQH